MAISASGFPGGGLARESISSLPSRLKGQQLLTAHPEPVVVADGGRAGQCPAVDGAWVSAPLLGTRREASQQESVERALRAGVQPACPPWHGPHLSTATPEPLSPDDTPSGSWVQSPSSWGDVRTNVLALKQIYLPN